MFDLLRALAALLGLLILVLAGAAGLLYTARAVLDRLEVHANRRREAQQALAALRADLDAWNGQAHDVFPEEDR